MAAANKPVWVQVAEAGFGDRLEELGWKQVSPAHWRLDGDGVIWRTLLDRAPKDTLEDRLLGIVERLGGVRAGRLVREFRLFHRAVSSSDRRLYILDLFD